MNFGQKKFQISMIGLVLLLLFFISQAYADREEFLADNFFETYDGQFRERDLESSDIAKDIASSSATEILERTRTGKKLSRLKRSITNRLKFEYRKNFDTNETATILPGKLTSKQEFRGISFSGRLDENLSPVLEFKTMYNPVSISTRFNPLNNEFDCEISSRRLNGIMGVRSGIGFVSDGSETKAVFKLKFEF